MSEQTSIKFVKSSQALPRVWTPMNHTDEGLASNPTFTNSATKKANRMTDTPVKTSEEVGGPFNFEFRGGEYDEFLELLLFGAWTTDVLKAGTTIEEFEIEQTFEDMNPLRGLHYSNMRVNDAAFTIDANGIITVAANFVGSVLPVPFTTGTVPSEQTDNSVATLGTNAIFESGTVSNIELDTVALTESAFSLSCSVNNNHRGQGIIGQYPMRQKEGTATIEGSMGIYPDDLSKFDLLQAGLPHSLKFDISDYTATPWIYQFFFPRIIFTGGSIEGSAQDTDRVQNLVFSANDDVTEGTALRITRTAGS